MFSKSKFVLGVLVSVSLSLVVAQIVAGRLVQYERLPSGEIFVWHTTATMIGNLAGVLVCAIGVVISMWVAYSQGEWICLCLHCDSWWYPRKLRREGRHANKDGDYLAACPKCGSVDFLQGKADLTRSNIRP